MIRERLPKLGRGGRPLRIGYGRIFHEANAHTPLVTTLEDFERLHALEGEPLARAASLSGTELASFMPHAELTGFVQAARLAGNVQTVPLASFMAVPSGPVTRECFEHMVSRLLECIAAAGPLDGVYLALHGSMEVVGLDEAPEAVILARVRQALGAEARIAASFDLHGNLTAGIVDALDVLVAYRTNPHWDLAPTGFRAGTRLIRCLRDQIEPVHAWRKLPIVLGGGMTIDFLAPMRGVFRFMRRLERDPRVISASLFMVHPYTSAENLGWAVHVCTDGDERLAQRLAEQLADRAWAQRDVQPPPILEVAEALEQAKTSPWRKLGPVTLVDVDDIVGAGAPGGNTAFVAELARGGHGLRALLPLHDPAAVEQTWALASGTEIHLSLCGTPGYGAAPVPVTARVMAKTESEFGRSVRLDVDDFHVAVTERPPLPIHPKFWRDLGIDPRRADVMVQKNFFHYRMFHLTTSFRHLPVKSRGATSFDRVRTRSYPVPMQPAVRLDDWRPWDAKLRTAPRVSAAATAVAAADTARGA